MAKDKAKKTPRPRAETPRGFRDYAGADVTARRAMLDRICEVYHHYGFDPLETPAVETVEALGKFLPDVDQPNEGIFAWQDDDETWLGLRYDLTAPLARYVAQNRLALPTPYRRYQVGPVWRNEKPGPGRFRQFYQCDADTVGTPTVAADAEICMMLSDAFEAIGIARDDLLIRIYNRKVLNGVLETIGLLDSSDPDAHAVARGVVLRAIDKLDRLGEEGVRALLGEGRRDESGDYTRGAQLSDEQIEIVMGTVRRVQYLHVPGQEPRDVRIELEPSYSGPPVDDASAQVLKTLREYVGHSRVGLEGVQELEHIAELLHAQGYSRRATIDPSVVRGLGYYTGPIFEAELTFEITDEDGRRRQFGSVAGGGRYDDLVRRFTGQAVPATGVSIGVDRLLTALHAIGRAESAEAGGAARGPVVILVLDRARMAAYQAMCAELRSAGIRAEVFLGGGNMGKQLKYADRRTAPVAVIEGSEELAQGVVTLKDLALGARLAAEIESREEWTAQPAQVTVPRADLVAEVRKMLARETP